MQENEIKKPGKCNSDTNKSLGFLYLAKRPCGRVSAIVWDIPGHEKSTKKAVDDWVCRGDKVERVERFSNDPMPEFICSPNCTECRNQTIKHLETHNGHS